jgi:hypothetical protein
LAHWLDGKSYRLGQRCRQNEEVQEEDEKGMITCMRVVEVNGTLVDDAMNIAETQIFTMNHHLHGRKGKCKLKAC